MPSELAPQRVNTAGISGAPKAYFDRFGLVLKLNEKQINAVYKRLGKWLPNAIKPKSKRLSRPKKRISGQAGELISMKDNFDDPIEGFNEYK